MRWTKNPKFISRARLTLLHYSDFFVLAFLSFRVISIMTCTCQTSWPVHAWWFLVKGGEKMAFSNFSSVGKVKLSLWCSLVWSTLSVQLSSLLVSSLTSIWTYDLANYSNQPLWLHFIMQRTDQYLQNSLQTQKCVCNLLVLFDWGNNMNFQGGPYSVNMF